MKVRPRLLAFAILGCVTLHSKDTNAQGFATTCAKFLWDQVGKPLVLDQAGSLIREYFAGKPKDDDRDGGHEVRISRDDIANLREEYEA